MNEPCSSAIHYHPGAFTAPQKNILGRHSAGAGFFNALLQHGSGKIIHCYAPTKEHFAHCKGRAMELGWPENRVQWIHLGEQARLAEVGCLYHPEPTLAHLAWNRRYLGAAAYSLCGVTHTLCSSGIMEAISNLLVAPTESWDALICTSAAARSAVLQLFSAWSEYLDRRLRAKPPTPLELPVIPLGVHCDAFKKGPGDEAVRASLRAQMGIGNEDVAILFVGRLSYHAKAHPLPMYAALEEAAQRTQKRLHLIHFGWFANRALHDGFVAAARKICPSVNAIFVDGAQPGLFQKIWHAADVFTSLADNIQETFGLAPLEAMAAGLPVVVSDWDGYRDTVRHGIDGFRVPTLMPPAGSGTELSKRYSLGIDNYDRYIGHVSQLTAVDVPSSAAAYLELIENEGRRRAMGEAARERAQTQFDWRHVIRAYEELWTELAARRNHARTRPAENAGAVHPLCLDPFAMFAGHATKILDLDTQITVAPRSSHERLDELRAMPITSFAVPLLSSLEECQNALQFLTASGPCTVAEILSTVSEDRQALLHRTLGWLAKVDLIRVPDARVRADA